jgi:hypothetical protein
MHTGPRGCLRCQVDATDAISAATRAKTQDVQIPDAKRVITGGIGRPGKVRREQPGALTVDRFSRHKRFSIAPVSGFLLLRQPGSNEQEESTATIRISRFKRSNESLRMNKQTVFLALIRSNKKYAESCLYPPRLPIRE